MKIVVVAIAGALGSALANRGIAVYHDGLRPIMPELIEGRMKRVELATIAFGLSFGLVIGFGIPFSLTSSIILVHSLWLGTDIIGTWFPGTFEKGWMKDKKSMWGFIGSLVVGGVYGALLVVGLQAIVNLFEKLPINFFGSLGSLGDPIIYAFAIFPAVAVAMQFGITKGLITFALTILARQIASTAGLSSADGIALAVGILVLMAFAIADKPKGEKKTESGMQALFTERANRIKKNLPYIALMGAVYGIACNLAVMMEGPQSITALAAGDRAAATSITVARAISFIPLKAMTSLTSGVFAIDGFGFVATVGLLSPSWIIAAIAGAATMSLEAYSLVFIGKLLDKFPGVRNAADNIRTSMTKLLEVATLVGSMIAANTMAPGLGFLVVAGAYMLNEITGTRIVRMAIGPIAAIFTGVLINILAVVGLYIPAA
ncbi:MAG: hypothetical protein GYA52_12735 [Chloroflexi bacterium]|nr:hypothetical protein [Chloroflexota bacterium]